MFNGHMLSSRATLPPKEGASRAAAEVLAAGEVFKNFGGVAVARSVIAEGGGLRDFQARLKSSGAMNSTFDLAMGFNADQADLADYSLTGLLMGRGGKEREVATEIMMKSGIVRDGHPIPWAVLARDFTVAGTTGAANLAHGDKKATEYLRDPLRASLALARLGAVVTTGFTSDFSVPRFDADASAAYAAEVSPFAESQPATAAVSFKSKRLGGYVDVAKMALMSGGPYIEAWITRVLRNIVMAQLEWGAINGTETASTPLGVRNTPDVQSVVGGANGALFNWGHLTELEHRAGLANAPDSPWGGYLTNTHVRLRCKNTQRAAGLPFMWDNTDTPLNGYRTAITSNVPSNLTKGTANGVCSSVIYSSDWSACLVPIFGAPEVGVDHVSMAREGLVRVYINIWMGAGLLHPEMFAVMNDALTV
jgi:HK97 family phage major capsid protein